MGPGITELMGTVSAQEVGPAGSWFSHHLKMKPHTFDFEIGVPVSAPVTPAGRVKPSSLLASRVAHATDRGPYEGLGDAWGELMKWIETQGLTPAADLWEYYAAGLESSPDPANWRTELYRPLGG